MKNIREALQAELIWVGTKQGATPRSRLYKSDIKDKSRKKFIDFIKKFCYQELFIKRKNISIPEKELYRIIDLLISKTNNKYSNILIGNELKFGNAQKFVNLYLKYMWTLNRCKEPPHFPIDRIIQKGFGKPIPWTNMSKEEYKQVISRVKEKIKTDQLAKWESIRYLKIKNDM